MRLQFASPALAAVLPSVNEYWYILIGQVHIMAYRHLSQAIWISMLCAPASNNSMKQVQLTLQSLPVAMLSKLGTASRAYAAVKLEAIQ